MWVVQLLKQSYGTEIDRQDKLGMTALHHAARGTGQHLWQYQDLQNLKTTSLESLKVVKVLLKWKTNPDILDNLGQTGLNYAKHYKHGNVQEQLTRVTEHQLPYSRYYLSTQLQGIQCELLKAKLNENCRQHLLTLMRTTGTALLYNVKETNIIKNMFNMMCALVEEVRKLDERFHLSVECTGSVSEDTKIGYPDECDFMLYLNALQHNVTVQNMRFVRGFYDDFAATVKVENTKSDEWDQFCWTEH